METKMKIVKTQRGRDKILYRGYSYRAGKKTKSTVCWRCSDETCSGSISTPLNYREEQRVKECHPHNHAPDVANQKFEEALDNLTDQTITLQAPLHRIIIDKLLGDSGSQKMASLSVQQIMQARNRIKNYVRRTPLEFSPFLSQNSKSSKVYIKCENLQLTGSFKIRGAFNKVCLLKENDADISQKGAVSASTGNHALACTEAMNQLGVPIRIFVPENISSAKLERLRINNAILNLHGQDCIYAEYAARNYSEENNIPFISPYNDIDVAAGQGTIGIEIFEDLPDVDNVLVPVGGGGLIGGIAAYLKQINPRIQIYGCQPIQSKVMYESIKAGSIIFEESGDTLSDGTSGGIEENSVTFELCRTYVDHWLLVEEEDIAKAIYFMLSHHHMMIEGAAGVSLGAYMTNAEQFNGQKTVIIACGANISMEKLKAIIQIE